MKTSEWGDLDASEFPGSDLASRGSVAQDYEDTPREACGLFGVYGLPDAALAIHAGLFSLQHRGQEGAGIAVSDGIRVTSSKGIGKVNEVFSMETLRGMSGHLGIGHVRYSTTGSSRIQNVQPLVVECADGIWAIAHNGNLTNAQDLRRMYQQSGSIFQTSTDSEVLIHLLADPMYRNRPRRVARALAELKGAFAFLLMTNRSVMAARDPMGFKPLTIGALGPAYVLASETCALTQIGARPIRDVEPGELVTVDEHGLHSTRFAEPEGARRSQCVFEHVYFARPDSDLFGCNVHSIRVQLGMRLAREHPVEADVVTAVPDSGNSAALGYSRQSGVPLDHGFIRNHYVGRTFIMPDAGQRERSVDMKLSVVREVVDGKRVVVVDDSIVRGTTALRRVKALREAGAREIHVRISCPPTICPCFFGIDLARREELIAGGRTTEEVCAFIGADSLGYLSLEGLLAPFPNRSDYCTACFTGSYPLEVGHMEGKGALEKDAPHVRLQENHAGHQKGQIAP
ncbi:MAG: amidophosphoribosyltransferase [Kiritimatiellae bacterium]|nr:amidophosphoribosyltransferase [Kiritimatiellia bacterium]